MLEISARTGIEILCLNLLLFSKFEIFIPPLVIVRLYQISQIHKCANGEISYHKVRKPVNRKRKDW